MPQDEGGPSDANQPLRFTLELLTPEYEPENHGLYLGLLLDALGKPEVRNVALTGAYGTGKSSVLVELARTEEHKALNISLSSMGLDAARETTNGDLTNQIQKEIVKQILYTVEPGRAPRSRFGRTSNGRFRDGLPLAVLVGAVAATAVTFGQSIVSHVTNGFSQPWLAFAATFLAVGVVTYVAAWMTRGRVSLEKVAAGPATVSLSRATASYFDEYLDEIVYFFEVTKYDLVIFEDIDRFDDTGIFEALRSLNTLLNSAPQLTSRPVRFVYAMRDSLFQKLEDDLREPASEADTTGPDDQVKRLALPDVARHDVERANRTKFFDLVVPVVPFITRENARDIMARAFREDGYGVSDRLLDIVARHIADMRLVTNIRNEFKVFHYHLIDGPHPVPELDADKLLALVVYKNVHLADFEKIRLGTSNLDDLYQFGRDLITDDIEARTERVQELRTAIANQDTIVVRREALGRRLGAVLEALGARVTTRGQSRRTVAAVLDSEEFWRDVSAGQGGATINISGSSIPVTPSLLGALLNEPVTAEQWDTKVRPQLEAELARLERAIAATTRATWKALYRAPKDTTATKETFADATRRILGSDLAADLVQHGQLDEYFSLNIAPFYAEQISRNAMNFVQRNIDRGVVDLQYALSGPEIDAILNDRPHALEDVGAYNITVLDYLLTTDPGRAGTVIAHIPKMGAEEAQLLNGYVNQGSKPIQFVEHLAPLWPGVFVYLTEDAHVEPVRLAAMVDAALRSWSDDVAYDLNDRVRAFIEQNYAEMPSLSGPRASARAARVAVKVGATLDDLSSVGDGALPIIKEANAYTITAPNLARASGLDSLGLDRLAAQDAIVHAYVLAHIDEYLDSTGTEPTVETPGGFVEVLKSVSEHDETLIDAVVARADPACILSGLASAPPSTWRALASDRRFAPNTSNLHEYVSRFGVDDPLAMLLKDQETIANDEATAEAMAVVVAFVNASGAFPDPARRVSLVSGVKVDGHIPASSIPSEPTVIVSLLLERGLVEDGAPTFSPKVLPDPDSFAAAAAASTRFATFMTPALVTDDRIAALFGNNDVNDAIKRAVVADLQSYLVNASATTRTAVAEYCLNRGVELDESQLALLQGHVATHLLVRLIAQSTLPKDALVRFLRSLGGSLADVSKHGKGKVQLPDDDAHAQLAGQLKAAGIVSSFRADGKGNLDVWRHHGGS